MRVTFFAGSGARAHFVPFAERLRALGHDATVVSPEATGGDPARDYDYREICAYSDWREPGCERVHRERARSVAGHVEACLRQQRADIAVVWGNASYGQRAAAAVCRQVGVPVVFSELGWFRHPSAPGRTLLFDCVGLNDGPTELSLEWWDERLTMEQDTKLDEYIAWWKRTRSSKHTQQGEPLPPQVAARKHRGLSVLLVLLQADWDAAAFFSEGGTTGQAEVMRLIRRAAGDGWLALVKEHPGAMRRVQPADGELWVRDVNIHDCFAVADCVITANSNGGLEALLYERPVICLADAPYGRLGFTFDARDVGTLKRMLERMRWIKAPALGNRFLRSFLYYVIFEYCFAASEVEGLLGKLRRRLGVQ